MAGLCAPLSTLRQYPHGYLRMTRGRCGSLLLHRDGLPPSTPCRSPGALRSTPTSRHSQCPSACLEGVESECGAVAVGRTYLLPPLSFGGALLVRPWLRFHIPLIEPDMQISRIRLSDKTSRLHPRHLVPKPAQTYEPEVPVQVREWIAPALAPPPDLMLGAQPPTQPHCRVI